MALPSYLRPSQHSTIEAGGLEALGLDLTLLSKALAIRDWLLTEGAQLADPGQISPGLAERLIALGVPIDRIMSVVDLLHSQYAGVGRFWTKEESTTSRLFPHGPNRDRVYTESPFVHVHRTGEWLLLDLAQTPDSQFNIIPDLNAAGYRHYLVVPIFFTNGTHHGLTFARRGTLAGNCVADDRHRRPLADRGSPGRTHGNAVTNPRIRVCSTVVLTALSPTLRNRFIRSCLDLIDQE